MGRLRPGEKQLLIPGDAACRRERFAGTQAFCFPVQQKVRRGGGGDTERTKVRASGIRLVPELGRQDGAWNREARVTREFRWSRGDRTETTRTSRRRGGGAQGSDGSSRDTETPALRDSQSGPVWPAWRSGALEQPTGGVESQGRSQARAAGGRSGVTIKGGLWGG